VSVALWALAATAFGSVVDQARPARGLIATFAGPEFADWNAYRRVAGVTWRGPRPIGATGSGAGETSAPGRAAIHVMSGTFSASAARPASAMQVAIGGNAHGVRSLTFAASGVHPTDTAAIAARFDLADGVRAMAGDCLRNASGAGTDRLATAFHRIDAGFARPLYLETTVDRSGARLAATVFRFHRESPTRRIATMRCRGHVPS
jgi:hypothetical protein